MNEHQEFFNKLLEKAKAAYEASEIKRSGLQYSVCATPLFKNSVLILGFNWGAAQDKEYEAQKKMETKPFTQLDLGSFKRTFKFFDEYLPKYEKDKFVQTNLCFFRSKEAVDISQADLKLSQGPFEAFMNYINPSEVISFSRQVQEYFSANKLLTEEPPINITSGKKTFQSMKASLKIGNKFVPISFLPHPNYPITSAARGEAWQHCFGKPVSKA